MVKSLLKVLLCSTTIVFAETAKDKPPMIPKIIPPTDVAAFPVNPLARYGLPEMAHIWSDQTRFQIYYEIEGYINEALAQLGIIPQQVVDHYWAIKEFSIDQIREHEKTTQHEFLAFLATIGDKLGDEAKSVHYGITSSNVLDTGFNIQLDQSLELIQVELKGLLTSLEKRAREHQKTLCIGRTHGMHAEPISFGLKLLRHYAAFDRHLQNLREAQEAIRTCAIGGALGNFTNISPKVEQYVAQRLNFKVEPIASQVIPRDRYGKVFAVLSLLASSIEELATEIRHLQRSEVGEVQEPFKEGQKGSSA
ncbi:MAG TPA: lyase family protein, partial [Candidatus Nitrosotenuis sp.]|nr:lyase family protein [Candidatus Nitrosotenuis sp.]